MGNAIMIKKYVHPSNRHLAETIERLGSKNSTTLACNENLTVISQVKGKVG